MTGKIVFVHIDDDLANQAERILCDRHPAIHVEKVLSGRDALIVQSMMRTDVVVMSTDLPDMSGSHLICELKRDIINPSVLVCSRQGFSKADREVLRMCTDVCILGMIDAVELCGEIEKQLRRRMERSELQHTLLEEAILQRVFLEQGISADLKGCGYLKYALRLLVSGEARLEPISRLYEQVGNQFGRSARSIERDIRYVVSKYRMKEQYPDSERMGNSAFIRRLLELSRSVCVTSTEPRVSVLLSGRRVFH